MTLKVYAYKTTAGFTTCDLIYTNFIYIFLERIEKKNIKRDFKLK